MSLFNPSNNGISCEVQFCNDNSLEYFTKSMVIHYKWTKWWGASMYSLKVFYDKNKHFKLESDFQMFHALTRQCSFVLQLLLALSLPTSFSWKSIIVQTIFGIVSATIVNMWIGYENRTGKKLWHGSPRFSYSYFLRVLASVVVIMYISSLANFIAPVTARLWCKQ